MTPDPSARPPRAKAPTLAQLFPAALSLALRCGLGAGVLRALIDLTGAALDPGRLAALTATGVLARAGFWAALIYLLVQGGALVWRHRALQDRAFTCTGLLSTFFGLAMLLVFFAQLGREAALYFQIAPALIERQNEQLVRAAEGSERYAAAAMAQVRQDLADELAGAATARAKQQIEEFFAQEVIPNKLRDLEITAAEKQSALAQGYRAHSGAGALVWHFLTSGASEQPQDAGIWPALIGSVWVALITLLFAVPVGVGAALYLEEYSTHGWLGRIIQINVNNLAGVPSVVYGILGAFVFVTLFQQIEHAQTALAQQLAADPETPLTLFDRVLLWRPVAARNVLGGGLTLGLLTLPVVIVAAQEAIRAVPASLRQGAYALGATHWQVIRHQVLPMAAPGILTGTILAIARALGEAAPLVLFGAILHTDQTPGLLSRFSVLPMQIFAWSDLPPVTVEGHGVEIWQANAALASLILVVVLLLINAAAILLRQRTHRQAG